MRPHIFAALALAVLSLVACDLKTDDGPELFCDDDGCFVCDRGECQPAECSQEDDCPSNARCDGDHPLMSGFHFFNVQISMAMQSAATPYEPQT